MGPKLNLNLLITTVTVAMLMIFNLLGGGLFVITIWIPFDEILQVLLLLKLLLWKAFERCPKPLFLLDCLYLFLYNHRCIVYVTNSEILTKVVFVFLDEVHYISSEILCLGNDVRFINAFQE